MKSLYNQTLMKETLPLETISFRSVTDFEKWLHANHTHSPGIWLQLYKKGSNIESISYMEAVHVALCYGWIDSQVKSIDEKSYSQKFTPRKNKSIWSKINTQRVEKLIAKRKMRAAGLKEVEAAKTDGRWDKAYHSPATMEVPPDLLKRLLNNTKAKEFFDGLSKSNKYSIAFKIETAKKPETRARRLESILTMLKNGEKPT
jgi:uncharacterized protein YdeI (YjbR/CyaY-like superfamily)